MPAFVVIPESATPSHRQPDAAKQLRESGIRPQAVKHRIAFDRDQVGGALLEYLLEPIEGLVFEAKTRIYTRHQV